MTLSAGLQPPAVRHLLPCAEPFAWQPLFRALAAHAVPGLEETGHDDGGAWVRRLVSGPAGPALVRVRFGRPGIVEAELALAPGTPEDAVPGQEAAVLAAVRRWLDLDADPAQIDPFLAGFDLLAPLVAANPGLRVPGSVDGFETAVQTILGQQVSLAAARTFGSRLVASFGGAELHGFRAFPSAGQLAAVGPTALQAQVRITHSRARTIISLAEAVAGGLALDTATEPLATRAALLALPGIGPWTADYLAVRVFGDRDAYPADDLVLKRALGVTTARAARDLSEPWRPWRAYALFHLWTGAAY
ncbi:DNA-3-methyladenine glycosylase 2 family protein [Arthrobacter sp. zg-ZUI100]|uniref:DNA-3-methyladenine glycosylase family protein n=1 Tax=Arthrobacter jiangjiafuii TaxID=2817475 RepID=UPI001AEE6667|nr:DNA-3-methyladenine glycosylase 2 family protein [Arthrobacter jiangjiafuii]